MTRLELARKIYAELYGAPKSHEDYANSFNIIGQIKRLLEQVSQFSDVLPVKRYEIHDEVGVWKSVADYRIEEAKDEAIELNAKWANDLYNGKRILGVEFMEKLPYEIGKYLSNKQAILFRLEQ